MNNSTACNTYNTTRINTPCRAVIVDDAIRAHKEDEIERAYKFSKCTRAFLSGPNR